MRFIPAFVFAGLLAQGCGPGPTPTAVSDPGELATFCYRGEPIHPGAVQRLVGILADPLPVTTGVDLEGWSRSEDHGPGWTTNAGTVEWRPSDKYPDGCFAYRHAGRTPGGTHVIMTYEWGGGSGRFEHVLLVRFERGRSMFEGEPRPRIVMKQVGLMFLGDRQGGTAVVKGNKVTIGSWTGYQARLENRTAPVEIEVD